MPRKQGYAPGVTERLGGRLNGVNGQRKGRGCRLHSEVPLGPRPVASLHKLAGDISSTISSLGKGNTVLLTSKSPLKHWEIPGTSDTQGC